MNAQHDTCDKIREYLDSYLSNELLVETNHIVLSHLRACPACANSLANRERVRSALKDAVLAQEVPAGLQQKIHSKLTRKRTETHRWMLAAAASLLVAAGSWGTLRLWTRNQGSGNLTALEATEVANRNAEVLKIGLGDHVHCALDSGFANRSFTDPEISQILGPEYSGLVSLVTTAMPGDLKITVGHRCRSDGRQFIHLILRNQETVVSVVLTRKNGDSFAGSGQASTSGGQVQPLYEARFQGLEVTGLQAGDYLAFVVSNLPKDDNVQIASSLAPALAGFIAKLKA